MEFKEFNKEKMKEELRNDIYNLVYINYEKENGIKIKFREILIKIKENPDEKKVNRLKVLTGENKITKKEMVQFLEFLGGEKDERESN